jgi:sn-glycerol 3-phosphate transport system permease protein
MESVATTLAGRVGSKTRTSSSLSGLWFLAPAAAFLIAFTIYPALNAFWLSLHTEAPFTGEAVWNGLGNYADLFKDRDFGSSLIVSLVFALMTVPLSIGGGLLAAVLLHRDVPGIRFYRVLLFLPVAVPTATAAVAWRWLYHPVVGYINYALSLVGLDKVQWLQDPSVALFAVALAVAWQGIGLNAILLLAGLQGIPEELVEAARLDGARPWQVFTRITLPLLSPTLFFTSVVGLISALTTFGPIHILTQGGPAGATQVAVYRIYTEAFINFRFGYATAQAVVLFIIILGFSILQNRLERTVHYQ